MITNCTTIFTLERLQSHGAWRGGTGCAGVGDGDRHWGENGGTVQFPRLSENKHDTAWFGGHEGRPEQEDVRRGGMDVEPPTRREVLLVPLGLK